MMNKYFLIIILIFNLNCDKLTWDSTNRLSWIDFQGDIPDEIGLKTAVTFVQIEIVGDVYEGEIPDVKVVANFLKDKSWTVVSDDETLKHEQLHFDITELHARKLRKRFSILVREKEADFEVYKNCYYSIVLDNNEMQKKYDGEVYFNAKRQKEWQEKITKELEELKEYEYIPEK